MSAVAFVDAGSSFADRGLELLEKLEYRRADTDEEREEIFRFRYHCYLDEEAILPNPEERFTDHYDELGSTWLIGVYLEGRIVARCASAWPRQSSPNCRRCGPSAKRSSRCSTPARSSSTRRASTVDRSVSREHPHLPYLTARIGWLAGEYFQADTILATLRGEHQAFYRRVFNAKVVCEPRHYPTLIKPLGLMTLDYFAERRPGQQPLSVLPFDGSSSAG